MNSYFIQGDVADSLVAHAWDIYCKTTAGCMSAKDFWHELSLTEQHHYLGQAMMRGSRRSAIMKEDHGSALVSRSSRT